MVEKLPKNTEKCPIGFETCLGQFCKSYKMLNEKTICVFPDQINDSNFASRIRKYARTHLYRHLLKRENAQCQECGTKVRKVLQIHHKRYTEKLEDLELLCKECHQKLHILSHHKRFLTKVIDRLKMYDQDKRIKDVVNELKQKIKQNKYDWEIPD